MFSVDCCACYADESANNQCNKSNSRRTTLSSQWSTLSYPPHRRFARPPPGGRGTADFFFRVSNLTSITFRDSVLDSSFTPYREVARAAGAARSSYANAEILCPCLRSKIISENGRFHRSDCSRSEQVCLCGALRARGPSGTFTFVSQPAHERKFEDGLLARRRVCRFLTG